MDFDSQTLALDVKYDLTRNDSWYVTGSYAASRLCSPLDSVGEFYRYGFLNGSVTHFRQIGSAPVYLSVTGGAYWRHGDPADSDRVSGYVYAAAIYNICETLQLWGFTRPEVQHYTHDVSGGSRNDFNVTVGASLIWSPLEYLSVGATASYVGNFSSVSGRDYDLVTPTVLLRRPVRVLRGAHAPRVAGESGTIEHAPRAATLCESTCGQDERSRTAEDSRYGQEPPVIDRVSMRHPPTPTVVSVARRKRSLIVWPFTFGPRFTTLSM